MQIWRSNVLVWLLVLATTTIFVPIAAQSGYGKEISAPHQGMLAAAPEAVPAPASSPPASASTGMTPAPSSSNKSDSDRSAPQIDPQELNDAVYNVLRTGDRLDMPHEDIRPDKKTVYLTFDDGPSKLTPKVLDILKKEGVPATFFVVGENAETYPDAVRREVKEGHAIGNHSYDHVYSELYPDFDAFWKQILRTAAILKDVAGVSTDLLRAPGGTFGHFDPFYFYYLDRAGYRVFDWTIDSGDSTRRGVPVKEIVANVEKSPLSHEEVVLLHDGSGHDASVEALPEIIRYFRDKGYAFAKLTDRVHPPEFRVSRKAASRNVDRQAFERTLAMISRDTGRPEWPDKLPESVRLALGREESGQAAGTAPSDAASDHPADATVQPPLRLEMNGRSVALGAQYEIADGVMYVPLRDLFERLGGSVAWDDAQLQAAVGYGGTSIVYDVKHSEREVRTTDAGPGAARGALDIRWRDGEIWVPLRDTLSAIGLRVDSYAVQSGHAVVTAAS